MCARSHLTIRRLAASVPPELICKVPHLSSPALTGTARGTAEGNSGGARVAPSSATSSFQALCFGVAERKSPVLKFSAILRLFWCVLNVSPAVEKKATRLLYVGVIFFRHFFFPKVSTAVSQQHTRELPMQYSAYAFTGRVWQGYGRRCFVSTQQSNTYCTIFQD